jgi:hypothetical protein
VNRFLFLVAAATLPIVALAVVFAVQGPQAGPVAGAQSVSTESQGQPRPPEPQIPDGRHFGYIKSIDLDNSPPSIVFDEAQFLDGEAANEASAAHGDEVPVANDVYVVNDDRLLRTLTVSEEAEFLLLGPGYACCEGHPSDPDLLTRSRLAHAWGYWVTLDKGKVVQIEEQWHP